MNDYRLVAQLGRGGMGQVFEAHRTIGGEMFRFACKAMHPDLLNAPDYRQFFMNEAKVNMQISTHHPHVVSVFDCIEDDADGQAHIIMELVEGCDLFVLLDAYGAFEPDVLRVIARDTLSGLGHLHASGHFHRDVCPCNVLISRRGLAQISDLGLVKKIADMRLSDRFRGKWIYASPEAANQQHCDHRSDLFSCGAVLYELITGKLVYGNKKEIGRRLMEMTPEWQAPELPEGTPSDLRQLVSALLEYDPEARPWSARDACAFIDLTPEGERVGRSLLADMADAVYQRELRWREQSPRMQEKVLAPKVVEAFAPTDIGQQADRCDQGSDEERETQENAYGRKYRMRRRQTRTAMALVSLLGLLMLGRHLLPTEVEPRTVEIEQSDRPVPSLENSRLDEPTPSTTVTYERHVEEIERPPNGPPGTLQPQSRSDARKSTPSGSKSGGAESSKPMDELPRDPLAGAGSPDIEGSGLHFLDMPRSRPVRRNSQVKPIGRHRGQQVKSYQPDTT